jgi:hypothetical protein
VELRPPRLAARACVNVATADGRLGADDLRTALGRTTAEPHRMAAIFRSGWCESPRSPSLYTNQGSP